MLPNQTQTKCCRSYSLLFEATHASNPKLSIQLFIAALPWSNGNREWEEVMAERQNERNFFFGIWELAKLRCFGELHKLDGGGQKRYIGNRMEVEGLNWKNWNYKVENENKPNLDSAIYNLAFFGGCFLLKAYCWLVLLEFLFKFWVFISSHRFFWMCKIMLWML